MKCQQCGGEVPEGAISCPACGYPSNGASIQAISSSRRTLLTIGVVCAIGVATLLIITLLLQPGGQDNGTGGNQNSGRLVVTMVNPIGVGSESCNYTLYLDDEIQKNGFIPAGSSDVFEKNLSWSGPQTDVHILVEIPGTTVPSEDRTVTLTPGEVERITIILQTWLDSG